jgi:hypothetical protein
LEQMDSQSTIHMADHPHGRLATLLGLHHL